MNLPTTVDYPVIAVGDLHGQAGWLAGLLTRLEAHPVWRTAQLVFLGDFVDRGSDVAGAVQLVLDVLAQKPGSTAVLGNHDLSLTRAAGLDDAPPSEYWRKRYFDAYDHGPTFEAYLGRAPNMNNLAAFAADLAALRDAMPAAHRAFLSALPWGVAAAGHVFLHCGLSRDSALTPAAQWACIERKIWDRAAVELKLGSRSEEWFEPEYPVWIGADRRLAENPLPWPGRVQVTGHLYTRAPVVDDVKIRLDTTGGLKPPLTACILTGPGCVPEFVTSPVPESPPQG